MVMKVLVIVRIGLDQVQLGFSAIHLELRIPLAIALGAVPGALSRYYLTRWCVQWWGDGFPIGTLIVNLSGALAMGFFTTLTLDRAIASPDLRALVAVGFLGAYTTFSTYALETVALLQNGSWIKALAYWSGSAIFSIASLALGSSFARRLS